MLVVPVPTVREIDLGDYPGLIPGLILSLTIATAAADRVARSLTVGRVVAATLLFALGLIVSVTLTPSGGALHAFLHGHQWTGHRTCDLHRFWPATPADLDPDVGLNILLFVPLGLALAFLPRNRTALAIAAGAVALPFAIETIQLMLPQMGRVCQSADVADNLSGLAIGAVVGALAVGLAGARGQRTAPDR